MPIRPEIDIPDPEDSGPKEVFAFAGLALYAAAVFEAELTNLLAGSKMAKERPTSADEVEALFSDNYAKTLGQLIQLVRARVSFPNDSEALIGRALAERNRLIHHFFRDHSENFVSEIGRREMIADLREMTALFRAADQASESVSNPLFERLGVTSEIIAAELNTMYARAKSRDRTHYPPTG